MSRKAFHSLCDAGPRSEHRPCSAALADKIWRVELWALFLGWWHLAGERTPLDRVEASLADVRLLIAGRKPPQSDVVIIAIDDATVSNEKGYPIQRSTLARLIRVINAGKPRAIAIDILLVDETLPEADEALAKALKESPTIIAAAGKFDPSASAAPFGTPRTNSVLWPAKPFDKVVESGLVNIATDSSGAPAAPAASIRD